MGGGARLQPLTPAPLKMAKMYGSSGSYLVPIGRRRRWKIFFSMWQGVKFRFYPPCVYSVSDMPPALGLSRNRPRLEGHSVITRPLHHQNSVGTCCVRRVAQ